MSESTHPLSAKGLFDEIRQELGSPDRGFLRTAWKMSTAPGPTLRAAFRGEAGELTRPVRYFLMVFTLYALVYVSSGAMAILAADMDQRLAEGLNAVRAAHGITTKISPADVAQLNPLTYYLQYPLVSEAILAIALWLASWPALARMGLSATERLAATMYLYGTINLLQVPLVVLLFTGHIHLLQNGLAFLFVVYLGYAVHGLANPPRRWAFLRGIAWFLLLQGFSALLFFVTTVTTLYRLDHAQPATAAAPPPAPDDGATVAAKGPGDGMAAAPAGEVDARVAGTIYHATAKVRCSGYQGAAEGQCDAGVVRDGDATFVDVTLPDGRKRTLFFDAKGRFVSFSTAQADGTAAMAIGSRREGDDTIATLGSESYVIPDALVQGG
jgi:hypothetical protein